MSWKDEDVVQSTNVSSNQAWSDDDIAPQQPATNSIPQELKRQAGLTGRAALSAVGSIGAVPADFIGNAVNAVAGKEVIPNQRRALQKALTKLGLPEPTRPVEQVTQAVAEGAPAMALPATLPAQVLGNAAVGYANADRPQDAGTQAAIGGGLGFAGHAGVRALRGVVKPTDEAQQLLDRGVVLTPGQASGIGSTMHRAEQWAASNPVASVPIRNAQRRGLEESNLAAVKSITAIVDDKTKLGMPPREALEQARDIVGKTYDEALVNMQADPTTVRKGLESGFDAIVEGNPMMTSKGFDHMQGYVMNRLGTLADKGYMLDGPMLKQIDSEIGAQIRRLKTSTSATEKVNAGAWMDLQQQLRETMASMVPAEQSAMLNRANAAFRQLLAMEKALGGDTIATPRRLRQALEKADIKGTQLNQVSSAMQKTLPNTLSDSGTAERLIANMLPAALLGSGGLAHGAGWDTVGAGLMAAGVLGSRPGARAMLGTLPMQQKAATLADLLRRGVGGATRTDD